MNSKSFVITQRNGQQHTIVVDADLYDEITKYNWFVGRVNASKVYVRRKVGGKQQFLHHFVIGKPPAGMVTDHINGNTFDCRRANLRHCTFAQNMANQNSKVGVSGFKGVTKYGKRWVAQCYHQNKNYTLGVFDDPQIAHAAYCAFAKQVRGAFFFEGNTEAHS